MRVKHRGKDFVFFLRKSPKFTKMDLRKNNSCSIIRMTCIYFG